MKDCLFDIYIFFERNILWIYFFINSSLMEKDNSKFTNSHGATNYGDSKYWDHRYAKKKDERFQWLQPYSRLKPFIQKCLPKGKDSVILNIGCGNSSIQEYLYADGYHTIFNNDISSVVIEQMKKSQDQKGLVGMSYDVMDVRKMAYKDESFDLVIDKSTIDTLMCSDNPLMNVAKMIQEGYRVLAKDGYYFTVSYSGARLEHFLRENVNFQVQSQELVRIDEDGYQVKNFLYICRKLPMKKSSVEQRAEFYRKLKEKEEKDYPSS